MSSLINMCMKEEEINVGKKEGEDRVFAGVGLGLGIGLGLDRRTLYRVWKIDNL